jgi:hypothetical protein
MLTGLGGKYHPWYLPVVFTGLKNTPQSGKYYTDEFFCLKILQKSELS